MVGETISHYRIVEKLRKKKRSDASLHGILRKRDVRKKEANGQSREAGLSVDSAIAIASQIAQGLIKAHEEGSVDF